MNSFPTPRVTLALAGGNALGAYSAGAYEALHDAGYAVDLVSGASIGAVTAAIIAGNRPEDRVCRLHDFWDQAATGSAFGPAPGGGAPRTAYNKMHALQTMLVGRPGLFVPRATGFWSLLPGTPPDIALFDARPLVATLERLIDFERLNRAVTPAIFSSIDVESGEAVYFDSRTDPIDMRHLLASTAFMPGFAPVEIDGHVLADPGVYCNLPLDPLIGGESTGHQLCFAVDLYDVRGVRPVSIDSALERAQDLCFSFQTVRAIEAHLAQHRLRHRIATLEADLATARRSGSGSHEADATAPSTLPSHLDLALIAYRPPAHEIGAKAIEFSAASIAERWAAGKADMSRAISAVRSGQATRTDPGAVFYDCRRGD